MRKDWEYKKLGEIAENKLSYGSGASAIPFDNKTRYIRITDIDDFGNLKESIVSPNVVEDKYLLSDGDILFARSGATVGKTFLYKERYGECIYAGYLIRLVPNQQMVLPGYVYCYTQSHYYKSFVESNKKVVAQPNINAQQYAALQIPLPPKSTQEAIVAELDKLNEMIRLKKQQLEDYDQLAQSIFYEMFGDPVENEKGWEVKKLKEVSRLINGRAYKQNELLSNGKYKVLRVGNFFTNNSYYYSDLELDEEKYCENGDLLFAWSASFGAFIWRGNKSIYHYHIWKILFDYDKLHLYYFQYLLNTMTNYFMNHVHGIGMVHLTKNGMEEYILPLPPLPLQQQFAARIEAIEQQKQQVKDTIKDLETLLASRMQYWFD